MKKRSLFFFWFFLLIVVVILVNKETREDFLSLFSNSSIVYAPISQQTWFDMSKYSLRESSDMVLDKLSEYNLSWLTKYIADDGMYFLPYPYTDNLEDKHIFTSDELLNISQNTWEFLRGYWDGRGDEMILSFDDYYHRFVYNADFLSAPVVVTWDNIFSRGNTLINIAGLFPNSEIIEYHFPSFDPQYEWLDWKSLYLVFVSKNWQRYLKLIAHGEWTI